MVRKTEELTDLQDEMNAAKEASREREKALKAKYREAMDERARLASVDVSLNGPMALVYVDCL